MHTRRREFEREREEEEEVAALAATIPPAPDPTAPAATELALLRSAQQRIGNRAVSGVLAREPNPALKKAPAPRPPKPKLKTGREVDVIFDTSPYLKDMVGEKLRKVSLEKTMVLDGDAAFETAWVEYAKRSVNPDTGQTFGDDVEARAFLKIKGVRAFQDEDRGKVHILKARSDLGTQLHEGLHLHAADKWKSDIASNYNVNEGVTEFFTRKIGPDVGVERDDNSYLREFTSATHLVAAATEEVVAAAYFEGDLAALQQKIDGRGAGTWRQWLRHLEAGNFKAANALLKPP
jgi:hypothetical protein